MTKQEALNKLQEVQQWLNEQAIEHQDFYFSHLYTQVEEIYDAIINKNI